MHTYCLAFYVCFRRPDRQLRPDRLWLWLLSCSACTLSGTFSRWQCDTDRQSLRHTFHRDNALSFSPEKKIKYANEPHFFLICKISMTLLPCTLFVFHIRRAASFPSCLGRCFQTRRGRGGPSLVCWIFVCLSVRQHHRDSGWPLMRTRPSLSELLQATFCPQVVTAMIRQSKTMKSVRRPNDWF